MLSTLLDLWGARIAEEMKRRGRRSRARTPLELTPTFPLLFASFFSFTAATSATLDTYFQRSCMATQNMGDSVVFTFNGTSSVHLSPIELTSSWCRAAKPLSHLPISTVR